MGTSVKIIFNIPNSLLETPVIFPENTDQMEYIAWFVHYTGERNSTKYQFQDVGAQYLFHNPQTILFWIINIFSS